MYFATSAESRPNVYPWTANSDQAASTGWDEHSCRSGSPRRADAITWSVTSCGDTLLTSSQSSSQVLTARRFAATPDTKLTRHGIVLSSKIWFRRKNAKRNKIMWITPKLFKYLFLYSWGDMLGYWGCASRGSRSRAPWSGVWGKAPRS